MQLKLQFDEIEENQRCVQPDFRRHIEHCREILRLDLYLINPCMRMTLDCWVRDYRYLIMYATRCRYRICISARGIKFFSKFRLIDLEYIAAHKESWDLMNFHTLIAHQIVANRRILRKDWYSGIQEIYLVVRQLNN